MQELFNEGGFADSFLILLSVIPLGLNSYFF